MGARLFCQLVPMESGEGGEVAPGSPGGSRADALLNLEAGVTLEKLKKTIALRLRTPKEELRVWFIARNVEREIENDTWHAIRDQYLAEQEISPLLPLRVATL